jgi:hypothetical protein
MAADRRRVLSPQSVVRHDPVLDAGVANKRYVDDTVDADVSTHEAAGDPHPGYVLAAGDTMTGSLVRTGATTGIAVELSSGVWAVSARIPGDTDQRIVVRANGDLQWGSGSAARDVNLYRSAANVLKTDDTMDVAALLVAGAAPQFGLREIVTFASSGSFTKATYSWLRAVRVRLVGGGGGGAGAAITNSSQVSFGSGGGSAGYAEELILVGALEASETVTIGAAGTGGVGANGTDGGTTSFGAHVSATGGGGGITSGAVAGGSVDGAARGTGSGGDFHQQGANSPLAFGNASANISAPSSGADSHMGGGGSARIGTTGRAGGTVGAGGGGAGNRPNGGSTLTGGAGAIGFMVVELYG